MTLIKTLSVSKCHGYPLNLWISLLSSLGCKFNLMIINEKISCTNNAQWITFTILQAFSTATVYTYLKIVLCFLQFLSLTVALFFRLIIPSKLLFFALVSRSC